MRILLTGAAGMLGRTLSEAWAIRRPADEVVAVTRETLDLRDRAATERLVVDAAPDAIVHAAAFVGGIGHKLAHPTPYLLDNLLIDSSVLSAALAMQVRSVLVISSAAIYPEEAEQPISETALLSSPLEQANEGYAIAKIASARLCDFVSREHGLAWRAVAPSNLYGPYDDFSLSRAHLVAASIAKTHAAKEENRAAVDVWGDGTARREFTYAPDLAAWIADEIDALATWPVLLNVGAGIDHSIREYYEIAASIVGFGGRLDFDATKPTGVPRRLLDSTLARGLGWTSETSIEDGMAASFRHFLNRTTSTRTT